MPLLLEGGHERDAWPVALDGTPGSEAIGPDSGVFRGRYVIRFDKKRFIEGVWLFHGLDRGDVVEMDTYLYGSNGERYLQRSDHKETMVAYPGWVYHEIMAHDTLMHVHLVLRVNGKQMNNEHPRFGELSARGHFGIDIVTNELG